MEHALLAFLEDAEGNYRSLVDTLAEAVVTIDAGLRESLARVKMLSGMLPICAGCKKIRDRKGMWHPIESYIQEHSEADFSYGLCPDCCEKTIRDIRKGSEPEE